MNEDLERLEIKISYLESQNAELNDVVIDQGKSIAILEKRIKPGDCIIIRYCGPRGSGMPEMFYTTESLCASSELVATTAILTDGRFSGASTRIASSDT